MSTMVRAIISEAVAAGEGTFSTCSILAEGTIWKSSTNEPSRLMAWARTPVSPGTRSASHTSGSSRCNACTKTDLDRDRWYSPQPLRQCLAAIRQKPGKVRDEARSYRLTFVRRSPAYAPCRGMGM